MRALLVFHVFFLMQITVRYHALLRERIGSGTERLEFAGERTTLNDVAGAVAAKYPVFEKLRPSIQFAVNEELVKGNVELMDGDTLDVLPPFGGG